MACKLADPRTYIRNGTSDRVVWQEGYREGACGAFFVNSAFGVTHCVLKRIPMFNFTEFMDTK